MISITKATENDFQSIVDLGIIAVGYAHRNSAPEEDMNNYLARNYNEQAILQELRDPNNIYHIIHYNEQPVGFSKIVLNTPHPNIAAKHVTKLDRIYLLKEFYGLKLGLELMNFNIGVARDNKQAGIWLFTWIGNERAIKFYEKAGFTNIGIHKFYVTETRYNLNHQMYLTI